MFKSTLLLKFILTLMILISSALAYSPQFADAENKIPLRWKNKKIPISISTSLFEKTSNIKAQSQVLEAIKNSLKHWEDSADIEFVYSFSNNTNVSNKGSSGDGISLITIAPTADNLLLFDEKIDHVSAITRLFYTTRGEIREADIVLNPILLFTTDGTFGSFDLEATLTHEIGHFLGLGHSQVIGSTMHSHQGKNGIYNLPGFSSRTLAEDDKAGLISTYGYKRDNTDCCSRISGRLTSAVNKTDRQFHVWAENFDTGRVIAGILSDKDGNFDLKGLPKAQYNIYAQNNLEDSVTTFLGLYDLSANDSIKLTREIKYQSRNFQAKYLGFNGQLSSMAIPVSAGKSYTIYVGGKNLKPDALEIGFHTNKFKVIDNSIVAYNYGQDISVISFGVQIEEETETGDYSFYLRNKAGETTHFIGGLTLENSIQFWKNKLF